MRGGLSTTSPSGGERLRWTSPIVHSRVVAMHRRLQRNALALTLSAAEPLRAARRSMGAVRRRLRDFRRPPSEGGQLQVLVEVPTLDRGGLEQMVHDLVVQLDHQRFAPLVVCVRGGGMVADKLRAIGERVEVIAQSERAYREILEREHIDVVLSHYSTFGASLARHAGVPNVHVLHNSYTWLDDGGARRLAWGLREIEHFVAVSSTVASWAERRLHVPGERIQIVPNGIDSRRFAKDDHLAARKALSLEESDYVFLTIGTFEPRKGHRALLQAFARIAEELPQARLICAGNTVDAAYRRECADFVKGRGLGDRVRLLDYEPTPQKLYAAADVFVLPSVVEGFSLCTLEAAASGLPLILTAVGGAPDLLRKHDLGLLVPSYLRSLAEAEPKQIDEAQRNPPAPVVSGLADAMDEMGSHREKWQRAGARGPEIVAAEYDVSVMVRRYEALLARGG